MKTPASDSQCIIAVMGLVLASSSPRRAELLAAAGFSFEVTPVNLDERFLSGESAADYVARLASAKARTAASRAPESWVIGADTTVVAAGRILGKPGDRAGAADMLRALAGISHDVLTGVWICHGSDEAGEVVRTRVQFRALTEDEIAWYVATGEPEGKAGAYAIQGAAARFVDRIEGSYSNVVGLPIATVYRLLRQLDFPFPAAAVGAAGADRPGVDRSR
jgi:septum formation protein